MAPELIVLLMFLGLIGGLLLGHPVAFVLAGLAVIFGYLGMGPHIWPLFVNRTWAVATNHILIAIPLFIFMAAILERSGIAEGLFTALMHLFGALNGSIALAVVVLSTVFAAVTGVMGATVVSMSLMALPTMLRHGYSKSLSTGTVAAGGTLGIIIPPSIMLILMADQSNSSVGKLFAGGLIPGVLLAFLYFTYIAITTWLDPRKGPALSKEERAAVSTPQLIRMLLVSMVPPLLLIFGVLGSLWLGVATPTEASGIGAFVALLLMIAYGRFSWRSFVEAIRQSTRTSCMVIAVIIGASLFTVVFLGVGGGRVATDLVTAFADYGRWSVFAVMMLIVFALGFLIDWIGIILITFPIFLPIARSLGFDEVWFIIMIAVNLQASFLTPPVGYALFYIKGTAPSSVRLWDIYRGIVPFVALQIFGIVLLAMFPDLITFLPNLVR